MKHDLMRSAQDDQLLNTSTHVRYSWLAKGISMAALSLFAAGQSIAAEHNIILTAAETAYDDGLGNKLLAYKMVSHEVDGNDITGNYSSAATIPGPTIVLAEGDTVNLTIENSIPGAHAGFPHGGISSQVSVHVHGVHYKIGSDGTLQVINQVDDEGAGIGPVSSHNHYTYVWTVANGTAGTWPYHDHNYMTHNGAEQKGLFGAIIVNPAVGAQSYDKEYVLYVNDDAFWGMEIDGASKAQSKHGVNPTLSAEAGSNVRFHLISLGTDIHTFTLDGYQWNDPGTTNLINQADIGPLEKHVFDITATNSAKYRDLNFTNNLMGMRGDFNVE